MSTNVQNFLNYFENFLSPMSINISLFFKTFYRVVIPVLNISLFFKLFIYVDLNKNLQLTLSKNLYCQLHFCSDQCLRLKGAMPSIVSNRFCYVITCRYSRLHWTKTTCWVSLTFVPKNLSKMFCQIESCNNENILSWLGKC
jgi:hypothetical protein